MAKIPLNTDAIIQHFIGKQINAINEILEVAKKYAENISPVDTGDYINSHKTNTAEYLGDKVVGSLVCTSPYAAIIEYGVQGKTYNYHKGKQTIYRGVGNRTYQRTADATKTILKDKLKSW